MRHNNKLVLVVVALLVVGLAMTGCARKKTKTASGGGASLQKVHFDFDKYNIKSEFEGALKGNADWMNGNKKSTVVIEGHCDERGTAEYNIALGDRRAKAAKNYMSNLGVGADRMSTISYGKEKPVCTQSNESCWWQNRRDEFVGK